MANVIHNAKWRLLAKRCAERWFEMKYVAEREELLHSAYFDKVRFIVNHSGRRAYKTETAKRYIVKMALESRHGMPFFAADPTVNQARAIWWEDLKLLSFAFSHKKKPNETRLEIYPDDASPIHVVGLDVPARIEGQMWAGGVLDEFDNLKPETWYLHVRPALDSEYPDNYIPWCWLIGVPEIGGELEKIVKNNIDNKDWRVFSWSSEKVLSAEKIINAKKELSERQYDQEYGGKFVKPEGLIYSNYSITKNVSRETLKPDEEIIWTHDQNYTPLSSAVIVKRGDIYIVIDEIILDSADADNSVAEFVDRYKTHRNKTVRLYGDPHGRAGEKHGKRSDYIKIENELKRNGWKVENNVKMVHPAIKDRQNSLRSLICNTVGERRFFVNKDRAKWVHTGLSTVKTKDGSTFQEDDTNKYHHVTTALGYFADCVNPVRRDIACEEQIKDLGW